STGKFQLGFTFDYTQLASINGSKIDLNTVNPFELAMNLVTSFSLQISVPTYAPVVTPKISFTATYPATWITKLVRSLYSFTTPFGNSSLTMTFNLSSPF